MGAGGHDFHGPFAFMGPFLHEKILKLVFYDCVGPDCIYSYTFIIIRVIFGILILRGIKIRMFLWALNSILGPMNCAHCA